jgi:hypothetical protein
MESQDYPSWIAGRMPTSLSGNVAAPAATAIPAQIFKQGKKYTRKTKNGERKVMMRNLINKLDLALVDSARELEAVHAEQAIPNPLATLILDFFNMVIQVSDGTKNHRGKAPPTTLKSAKGLTQPLESFKVSVHGLVPPSTTSSELRNVLDKLMADVADFIEQIRRTHAIVTVVDGKPLMRNRPAKRDAMVAFAELVDEHQNLHGAAAFPKSGSTLAQLKARGHDVSPRTLRDWRKQMTNNTFGHFVQHRKQQ